MKRVAVLMMTCAVLLPASAAADTPGCASRAEYDNLIRGLSTSQVAGRLDTGGIYLGSGPERFRRGYDACFSSSQRVVVWYSLTTGLSDDWDLRDY